MRATVQQFVAAVGFFVCSLLFEWYKIIVSRKFHRNTQQAERMLRLSVHSVYRIDRGLVEYSERRQLSQLRVPDLLRQHTPRTSFVAAEESLQ